MKKYVFIIPIILILLFTSLFLHFNRDEKKTISEKSEKLILQNPNSDEILADLKKASPNNEHPRLMANGEDVKKIRESLKTDYYVKKWYDELLKKGNELLNSPLVLYNKSDGIRLLPISRTVLDRVITLSLLYNLNGNTQYAERAWKELETVSIDSKFPDWNPSHFLDTAEMATAVAIGYDWLYEYLDTNQKNTLQNALVNKAFLPALKVYNNTVNQENISTFWRDDQDNWNIVCNSGLILAALAIADESPELEQKSGEILQNAIKSIKNSLNTYALGQGTQEGPSYWGYSTIYIAYSLSSMDTALGTDYDLSKYKGLAETGYYPLYISGKSGIFNNGDAEEANFSSLPQLFWFSNKYNKADIAFAAYDKFSPMNIIWYRKHNKDEKNIQIPLDKYFKDIETGIVTMRGSCEDPNTMFVGIHAGDNQANHGDLDIGTFVLDALGERWASELGADNYNLPGYFGDNRWSYYRKRAEGQNTLVINPTEEPDQNIEAQGEIEQFTSNNKEAHVTIDMTDAYKEANLVQRKLSFVDNRRQIKIEDKIEMQSTSEIYWFMHTRANIILSHNKKNAVLIQNGKILYINLNSPSTATFSIMEATPLQSSPSIDNQHNNEGYRKLAIHLTNTQSTKISVEFSIEP